MAGIAALAVVVLSAAAFWWLFMVPPEARDPNCRQTDPNTWVCTGRSFEAIPSLQH
jgi:hypothetical protein